MSIVANFDINLRGNPKGVEDATHKAGSLIAELRAAVNSHASGISSKLGSLGAKMEAAFRAMPGATIITEVMKPAAFLAGAIGRAFTTSITGIMGATSAMGAFGAMTTMATAGLNLVISALAAIGTATVGAGVAWTGMGLASMGGIRDAQKTATKLGMSVEAVQGFAFKGKMELEDLSNVLLKMERNIGRVGGGDTPFARLNLDMERLKAATPEAALGMIADGFEGVKNQADRVSIAMDVFGKQGANALRLLKGGSQGIAEVLNEAKSLGIIASAGQAQGVAEASAALKRMKESMTGLGRTAAVTIAPFVKMIADTITEAMKWVNKYRDNIIDFAFGVEFAFKNFSEYIHLYFGKATLWVTEFANATIHIFTDVLPQIFRSFGEMLHEGLTTAFAGGFDKAWEKAIADVKKSMQRASGDVETALKDNLAREEKALDEKKQKFLADKRAALNLPPNGASASGGGSRDNGAVERGSAEAFKIIAGDQGDKMYKAVNDGNAIQMKILEELRKKRKRRPEIISVGRV